MLGELGRGGMGVVYEAHDDRLQRRVAIKTVELERVGPRGYERARREARALARLSHPHVVQAFEVGEDITYDDHGGYRSSLFLVMEHVEGLTLRRWQAAAPRSWREVLEVYRQVAAGLRAAHDKGLVHRDFKPDNAIIGTDGRVRVLDFGLACAPRDPTSHDHDPSAPQDHDLVTEAGVVMGTPAYMAPEQFLGKTLDARTDQFALCVSLFEALYGQRPFRGRTRLALLDAIIAGPPVPPAAARHEPPWVLAALMRGLRADPDHRFADIRALQAALARPRAHRRWIALGLVTAAVSAGAWTMGPSVTTCAQTAAQRWRTGWSPEQRDAVAQALAQVPVPYAEHSSARVVQGLDDYGAGWIEEHAAACATAHAADPGALEPSNPRMRCLAAGQRRFTALVDTLTQADATVVEHAIQAAAALPSVARCADEPRGGLTSPPTDPALMEATEALRRDLDRVITRYQTGQHVAAHELAVSVLGQARSLDDSPLRAEAGLWLAFTQDAMGRYEAAVPTLRTAFFEARNAGSDELAARIATQLVFAEGYTLNHHEAADSWAKHARADIDRLGGDPVLEPRVDMAQAHVESARGHYEAARAGYERAVEGFVAHYGPQAPLVALALSNQATAEQLLGSHDAALTHHHRALQMTRAALGSAHPEVSRILGNIGGVHFETGRFDDALEHFEAAAAILTEQFEPHHPGLISLRSNIAAVYWQRREIDRALEEQREVVRVLKEQQDNDQLTATALANMAGSLMWLERHAEARRTLRQALAIHERLLGPEHPELGRTLHNLATVEHRLELDDDTALEHARRALAIREQRLPPRHYDLSASHNLLASILEARGDYAAARDAAMKALEIREHGTIPSVGFLASTRMKTARLSWELDEDRHAARAMAQQARDEFLSAGDEWAPEHAQAVQWLEQHPLGPSHSEPEPQR